MRARKAGSASPGVPASKPSSARAARRARLRLRSGPHSVGSGETTQRAPRLRQVCVAVRARATRVRRRPELPQQPELLQRRLELRAELAPLDPLERAERGLDRRPLPLAREVRAQTRAQVAGTADVEDLAVPVAEEVHAGAPGRLCDQSALAVQSTRPRCGELREIADGTCPALLSQADQSE